MYPTSSVLQAAPAAKGFAVPRRHLRFRLMAEADVMAMHSGCHSSHLVANVSELSPRGCYLETSATFPEDTEVSLCIRRAGESCELAGRVIYVHEGRGMGLRFDDASIEQFRVLDKWLSELETYNSLARSELFLG